MHRKDELKILIENQKKEQKAFWDNVEKNRKHITKRVIDAVVQFAKQHGEDVEGKIDATITAENVEIFLKGCRWESCIRTYKHIKYDKNDQAQETWDINYGTSSYDWDDKEINFVKLKLFGLIARELPLHKKGTSELFKKLETGMNEFRHITRDGNRLDNGVRMLEMELQKLEFEARVGVVFADKGVKLVAPTNHYIRQSDNRATMIDEVVIDKVTDRAVTMTFKRDGYELDTYRQNISDAKHKIDHILTSAQKAKKRQEEIDAMS